MIFKYSEYAANLVNCPECGRAYTKSGINIHRGSKVCTKNQINAIVRRVANEERARLKEIGKLPVHTNTATSLLNRGLGEIAGVVKAKTRTYPFNKSNAVDTLKTLRNHSHTVFSLIEEEYWCHGWVKNLWLKYKDSNRIYYSRIFFDKMEKILAQPTVEERERLISCYILESLGYSQSRNL